MPVRLRHPEQLSDDQHRQRLGERFDDVDRTLLGHRCGAVGHESLGEFFDAPPCFADEYGEVSVG